MRIGVVSDTHNNMRNVSRIVELFNEARVERVIHTGDITQAKTLEVFDRLDAPMTAVYGNNDQERETLDIAAMRFEIELVEPPLTLAWADRRIMVVHDPLDLSPAHYREHDLVLHGHTHRHVCERRSGALVFNPGECAGHMNGYNAVGVVDLSLLAPERLEF